MGVTIGGWRVEAVCDGRFGLDGGAMFGVVPKPLWSRHAPPDEANRIPLALRSLLLRGHGRVALIDCGMGPAWPPREAERFALSQAPGLLGALAALGVAPEAVTDLLLTHLHFDHAGGVSEIHEGVPRLRFQNAVHHVGRAAWHWAQAPSVKDRGSFRPQDFEALAGSDRLRLVDGPDPELLPGVRARFSDGHTVGMMLPVISDGETTLVYCADLVPTANHLHLPWVMAYDLLPMTSIAEKRALLAEAAAGGWVLAFEHDPELAAARIALDDRGRARVIERVTL